MTDEQKEKMIELYNKGMSLKDIEKEIHICRKNISKEIKCLIDSGKLEERKKPHPNLKEMSMRTQTIVALYNDGVKAQDIADRVGCSLSNVSHIITRLREKGVIGQRKKPYTSKRKPSKKRNVNQDIVRNETPVVCNDKLAHTCIYGYDSKNFPNGRCNFMGCTGKSRLCMSPPGAHIPTVGEDGSNTKEDYTECYFYQKVSRSNPRRKSIEAMGYGATN